VAVENSVEGSVGRVPDSFLKSDLRVSSELFQRISLFLLSKTGDIGDIKVVASHPQPLGQSKRWLTEYLKHVELREMPSTAKAASLASRDKKVAAVAGELAASIYR